MKHMNMNMHRPDFAPPEIVRAMIAIQTGPGVINKIINAVI